MTPRSPWSPQLLKRGTRVDGLASGQEDVDSMSCPSCSENWRKASHVRKTWRVDLWLYFKCARAWQQLAKISDMSEIHSNIQQPFDSSWSNWTVHAQLNCGDTCSTLRGCPVCVTVEESQYKAFFLVYCGYYWGLSALSRFLNSVYYHCRGVNLVYV